MTHVASCGNVGLSAVDFKLTDQYADIPENQAYQQELLLPMDGCVYPYRRIQPAPLHPYHRANVGIGADAVVIGAFVSLLKLSRRCLALWRDVLLRVPRAKLAFSPNNAALRPYYVRAAAAAGIPADRLIFLPQGRDEAENQARYAMVDFTLDTMPYGGVNGTLEALGAGVPVVTLKGRRHGERSGFSILANLGVLHTVAESGPGFVEIAVRLANDPGFAAEVRAAIKAGLAASPLVDMERHARALETAYLTALQLKAPNVLAAVGIDATAWRT
jgi:predicted O-linked N-acetylglucosamine transferase (SPINDLY family)